MKIQNMRIEKLKLNPHNTRKHPKNQIAQIAESIRAVWFCRANCDG